MAPKTEERERQRVPTPPTTRRQEEAFAEQEEERREREAPEAQLREALVNAKGWISEAEEALDSLT